jgi:hypothetical protein
MQELDEIDILEQNQELIAKQHLKRGQLHQNLLYIYENEEEYWQ